MQIVYWAHSYRREDAAINAHFGTLIEKAGRMIVNFDPPSQSVNESKLLQNLRSCDGMVAVLPWRQNGPSLYILYEIALALRIRKPVVVFVDDRISGTVLPVRVMQQRFSHRTYFRQVREHVHALKSLKACMGDPPPVKYQPSPEQAGCGVLGLSALAAVQRSSVLQLIEARGYRVVRLEKVSLRNPLIFDQYEQLAALSVAVQCVDSRSKSTSYWRGGINAAGVPLIEFTCARGFQFNADFPIEFQPRVAGVAPSGSLEEVLQLEFSLYEQDFLSTQDSEVIDRYVKTQIEAGALDGRYEVGTRQQFIGAIMGDQYNISGQAGAVGPNAHAHDMTFSQVWNKMEGKVDLDKLADELEKLRTAMEAHATKPAEKLAIGAIAAAEESARLKDGPGVVEYLKTAGKWAFGVAEKIGVGLAKDALKDAIGL